VWDIMDVVEAPEAAEAEAEAEVEMPASAEGLTVEVWTTWYKLLHVINVADVPRRWPLRSRPECSWRR
jgi:hypothetical protein